MSQHGCSGSAELVRDAMPNSCAKEQRAGQRRSGDLLNISSRNVPTYVVLRDVKYRSYCRKTMPVPQLPIRFHITLPNTLETTLQTLLRPCWF
jgi:hypothetical protein